MLKTGIIVEIKPYLVKIWRIDALKIYNKQKFFTGIIGIFFVLIALISLLIKGYDLKFSILAILIFLISVSSIRRSISKQLTIQDKIEELDERNQEIKLKSNAISFKIIQYTVIFLEILFIIFYAIFKAEMLIWIILVLSFVVFVTFVSEILSSNHYKKKV